MDLSGQPGELRLTIEIKRTETGNVEVFDLVGHITTEEDLQNGSNTLDSCERCSD